MALILIYMLVVGMFGNFLVPAIIMAPIPLTLLGIVPGHWLVTVLTGHNAFFTATSMIGFIALAGIIVRNSILLVDFAVEEIRQGVEVREAVLLSCKARTRPIMITALALALAEWRGRPVSTLGDLGCFSFQKYKNVPGGEAGGILTNDDKLYGGLKNPATRRGFEAGAAAVVEVLSVGDDVRT